MPLLPEPAPRAETVTYERKSAEAATLPPTEAEAIPLEDDGVQVPGYEILGELGRGGMGVVYKARQTGLNRVVALKMILAAQYASADQLARFRAEAEAVARLQHPNIVQVYDIREHRGQPFFSLEFVDGGSLANELDGTPWRASAAAELVEVLAHAVQAAHRRGIIHRDLKPANVLLTADGRPKITDFGLAKQVDEDSGRTKTGAIMGTPSYMAPEQAEGRAKNIGPAADVYALGAILYELLTGRPPFKAETPIDTIMQVVHDDPVPPRLLRPKLPVDLELICLKCLSKLPEERYASALNLAQDLRHFLDGETISIRPAGWWRREFRWLRRHPVRTGAVAFICLGVVIGVWEMLRQQSMFDRMQSASRRFEFNPTGERSPAAPERPFQLRYTLASGTTRQFAVALSPVGNLVACGGEDTLIRVFDLTNGREAFQLEGHGETVYSLAINRDGNLLASASSDQSVRIWDLPQRKLVHVLAGNSSDIGNIVFSPDGQRLATAGGDRCVRVWDVASGRELAKLIGPTRQVRSIAWRPDGSRIAATGDDGRIHLWAADSYEPTQVLTGFMRAPLSLAFVPDRDEIVGLEWNDNPRQWDLLTTRHIGPKCYVRATQIALSPDGALAAVGKLNGEIDVFDIAIDPMKWQLVTTLKSDAGAQGRVAGHSDSIQGLAFNADGTELASASWDRTVKIWRLDRDRLNGPKPR
jgi:serine/threonine protein kinase